MEEIGGLYETLIQGHITSKDPRVTFFSTVSSQIITAASSLQSSYWRSNLESPVLFSTTFDLLLKEKPQNHVFLEIGPHSTLGGPIRQILKYQKRIDDSYILTLVRGQDVRASILAFFRSKQLVGDKDRCSDGNLS